MSTFFGLKEFLYVVVLKTDFELYISFIRHCKISGVGEKVIVRFIAKNSDAHPLTHDGAIKTIKILCFADIESAFGPLYL